MVTDWTQIVASFKSYMEIPWPVSYHETFGPLGFLLLDYKLGQVRRKCIQNSS